MAVLLYVGNASLVLGQYMGDIFSVGRSASGLNEDRDNASKKGLLL